MRENVGTEENVSAIIAAATLLRQTPEALPGDMAGLLSEVFHQWGRMGHYSPDFLNRVGGAETILLARAVIAHLTPDRAAPPPRRTDL